MASSGAKPCALPSPIRRALSAGSRQPSVQGNAAERAVIRFHLRIDLARLRLRSFHHRRVRAAHRRLEGLGEPATDFVLDALEQALYERRPQAGHRLVTHSDRGSQYTSIRYTERLAEAGMEPSVGSVGDSCDNAGRPSTRCMRPRSSIAATGRVARRLKWRRSHGSTGTTIDDPWRRSVTSRRRRMKPTTDRQLSELPKAA